jgi:transcriptional regulator with XRE-family HTH domain
MDDLRRRFGRLVAANRRRRGMTQHQLAEAADLSDDMIGRIEMGATGARFPSIERIARALDIDPAELFTGELPAGALDRTALNAIVTRLSGLSDRDLEWIDGLLDAALKTRGR